MNGKLVKARKDHRCELCEEIIPKGEEYWRERITPWDHDANESYGTFKAHGLCYDVWLDVGADYDWEWPKDSSWWKEKVDAYVAEQEAKNK